MKVIEEIIDYLLGENIITQEDFSFLQTKGFYRTFHKDYDDWDVYDSCEEQDDFDNYQNTFALEELETEKKLTDTRKRKQGKLGRTHSGKSKKHGNIQPKKRLRYFLITDKSISELSGNISNSLLNSIMNLKGKYFNSLLKFKTDLRNILSEKMQNELESNFSLIKSKIKHTYKIPAYIKKDDGFYITTKTFLKIKSNPLIINTEAMELFLLIKENKKIQLTNCYGKILHPISLKNY